MPISPAQLVYILRHSNIPEQHQQEICDLVDALNDAGQMTMHKLVAAVVRIEELEQIADTLLCRIKETPTSCAVPSEN